MKSIFDAKFHYSVRRIRRSWRIGVRSVIGWYDDHIVNSDGLQTQLQAETLKPDQWVVMRWWFNRWVAACYTRSSAKRHMGLGEYEHESRNLEATTVRVVCNKLKIVGFDGYNS
jgi:hypothetical protein